jgi:hypothetical protein
MPAKTMAKTKTKNVISDMSQKKKALPEVKKTPSKVTTILLNKNEKMPSVRKEPKFRNTEVKKRINFDQQERTQGEQSLSQRYGNLCPGQLTQR